MAFACYISCYVPPALLHGIEPDHGAQLMLIHLTTDRLCQWHPRDETLSSLTCKYCIVDRSTRSCGSILEPVNILMDIGLISVYHMVDIPHGSSYANTRTLLFPNVVTLLPKGWSPGCLVKFRPMFNKS